MELSEKRLYALMRKVGRTHFLPPELQHLADLDEALPIGYDQTISQPFIVAFMTRIIRPQSTDVVLEIGTGSGFQAAVLSHLVSKVYSVEIIEPLARAAIERLHKLGYTNIGVKTDDGYHGWLEHAPFDAIVVTACANSIPTPLLEQLKIGGRMVIPVQEHGGAQYLQLVEKLSEQSFHTQRVMAVRFVPFTRDKNRLGNR